MHKSVFAIVASTAALAACASNTRTAGDIATGAAIGGVGGAAVGAVVPGVSVATGALAGAAIGGLAGGIWADQNNDGAVDGYYYNNQYYAGTPAGYDPTLGRVATGAAIGAGAGGVAGALIPGVSVLTGAVVGAAVGGLAGAVWADHNNDGQVDGYYYNNQYYQGAPSAAPAPAPAPAPAYAGERG
jgi:hypothetical protein